jgi:hypothetical protein
MRGWGPSNPFFKTSDLLAHYFNNENDIIKIKLKRGKKS